jgi:hypothetical protein
MPTDDLVAEGCVSLVIGEARAAYRVDFMFRRYRRPDFFRVQMRYLSIPVHGRCVINNRLDQPALVGLSVLKV